MELTDANGKRLEIIGEVATSESADFILLGLHSEQPGFVFRDANIALYRDYFERFNCKKLALLGYSEHPELDIRPIPSYCGIQSLTIDVGNGATILIDHDRLAEFSDLRELIIKGPMPLGLPQLESFPNLRRLVVDYEQQSMGLWRSNKTIIDLEIHNYKEVDLHPLCKLASLQRLILVGGSVRSLGGIQLLPFLKTLFVANTKKLADVQALVVSKPLRNIRFESYQVTKDWSFLSSKADWEAISIEVAQSIDFIRDLPQLQFFYCKKVLSKNTSPQSEHQNLIQVRQKSGIESVNGQFDPFYREL